MIRIALMIILVFMMLLCIVCKEAPVGPPIEIRNPRTFVWNRDTLGNGSYQSLLNRIWGSSASNVYVVGHSSELASGKIWRFNGNSWSDMSSIYFALFPTRSGFHYRPTDVTGFISDEIWIVGGGDTSSSPQDIRAGFVLRKSAIDSWTAISLPTAKEHTCIGGVSSSDVWVGGVGGQMFHYDGIDWVEHWLGDSIGLNYIKAISSNEVYASGWDFPGGFERVKYFRWNGSQWSLVESHVRPSISPQPGISFDVVGAQLYSANGTSVSRRVSQGLWENCFSNANANLIYLFSGGGWVFASGRMADGSEALFNSDGSSWMRISQVSLSNTTLWSGWTTDDAVFVISTQSDANMTTFSRQFIIRGK